MQRVLAILLLAMGISPQATADIHWVQRPDDMVVYWFHDVDRYAGRVRILYSTTPSLQQGQAAPAGWRTNIYVVEARADGSVEQHRIASRHEFITALMLRRGHDEVLAIRRPETRGQAQRLERWSAVDGSVRGAALSPEAVGGNRPLDLTFSAPTGDGNLFVAAQAAGNTGGIRWYKLSAGGKVLAHGRYAMEGGTINPVGWFPTDAGGFGLSVRISLTRGANGLRSDIKTPVVRHVGGRRLEARVSSEVRLMLFDSAGHREWVSPALERQLMWGGQMQIPNSLPTDARLEQLHEQMRVIEDTELEMAARRSLREISRFKRSVDAIKPVPSGYGMLARTIVNRKRTPPVHGLRYLQLGQRGATARNLYLQPIADRLDAKFVDFTPTADGGLFLTGTRKIKGGHTVKSQVTRLSSKGDLQWSAMLDAPPSGMDGIAGTEPNVWVFGHANYTPQHKTLLWLERVDASAAAKEKVEPEPTPKSPPSTATGRTSAPAASSNGCSCSCEEFQQIQRLARQQRKTGSAPDAKTMQKLMCVQQCMQEYSRCGQR